MNRAGSLLRVVALITAVLAFPTALRAQVEWITESTHPVLWSRITGAFTQEMNDSVGGIPPYPPRGIQWVVLQDSAALVFVRYAYDAEWWPSLHRIYSYRLDTGEKGLLGSETRNWLRLEHEGVANFEVGAPDIVFRYLSCYECEAVLLLSSVKYDNNQWSIRTWTTDGEASESAMIGSSQQYGDYLWRYACAHRIWDSDSDGADELTVFCRSFCHDRKTEELKVQRDHAVLYDHVSGQMVGEEVTSPEAQDELYRAVCASSPTSNLCSN